jgi:hypothetical protein
MKAKSCDRAKSDMTPCVIRDGDICYAMDNADLPVCVGCGSKPAQTGVPKPADWDKQVADYAKKARRANR